ncbi:hypothetical protein CRG98_001871 [Punica granatum]|uniref:Uncharacterized protein n=1 Tax=Punica granatum TaxID=22663 RepID=A0A2I0LAN6_PUNGR|nr:hypothetical protein CRG98_001871 [Punica granatum]
MIGPDWAGLGYRAELGESLGRVGRWDPNWAVGPNWAAVRPYWIAASGPDRIAAAGLGCWAWAGPPCVCSGRSRAVPVQPEKTKIDPVRTKDRNRGERMRFGWLCGCTRPREVTECSRRERGSFGERVG